MVRPILVALMLASLSSFATVVTAKTDLPPSLDEEALGKPLRAEQVRMATPQKWSFDPASTVHGGTTLVRLAAVGSISESLRMRTHDVEFLSMHARSAAPVRIDFLLDGARVATDEIGSEWEALSYRLGERRLLEWDFRTVHPDQATEVFLEIAGPRNLVGPLLDGLPHTIKLCAAGLLLLPIRHLAELVPSELEVIVDGQEGVVAQIGRASDQGQLIRSTLHIPIPFPTQDAGELTVTVRATDTTGLVGEAIDWIISYLVPAPSFRFGVDWSRHDGFVYDRSPTARATLRACPGDPIVDHGIGFDGDERRPPIVRAPLNLIAALQGTVEHNFAYKTADEYAYRSHHTAAAHVRLASGREFSQTLAFDEGLDVAHVPIPASQAPSLLPRAVFAGATAPITDGAYIPLIDLKVNSGADSEENFVAALAVPGLLSAPRSYVDVLLFEGGLHGVEPLEVLHIVPAGSTPVSVTLHYAPHQLDARVGLPGPDGAVEWHPSKEIDYAMIHQMMSKAFVREGFGMTELPWMGQSLAAALMTDGKL